MTIEKKTTLEKVGIVLVALMAILQGFYAIYAFIDPLAFSGIRGTELVSSGDMDWIQIYASRTLFIALILAYLIFTKNYKILMVAALFGMVMPITDALLAYNVQAANKVVIKHIVTIIYLGVTFFILRTVVKNRAKKQ